jgi:formylglycine-generating enzyme required for sulfatase activity
MIHLDGGRFTMGSDRHYPEEAPAHEMRVEPFWIDATPVTNRQFGAFVTETGYVTCAEIPPDPAEYPGIKRDMVKAGSLVFTPPRAPVNLNNPLAWWRMVAGANWRHPHGPGSNVAGRQDHPVVHIAYADAAAYAAWAGKELPSEAEWEFAARGGLEGRDYAWGDEFEPGGQVRAQYWLGDFPWRNARPAGMRTTAPVRSYPSNGYGLFDMIGNVWEWTTSWYQAKHGPNASKPCCMPSQERASYDPTTPDIKIGRRVMKGGSHLCAPSYCQRYRPAARHPQTVDTSTSHLGFRCIVRG